MESINKPRSRDDFHIAILAALPHESDAILEMFDGSWKAAEYRKDERDRNEYELGYIGDHNVVVAFIGGMGPKDAQNVAESLRLSFRHIKLALVVGICRGVPIKAPGSGEILLGDTIVSTQVVDLTFARQYDDRVEIRTHVRDVLGRPAIEIRNFLHKTTTKQCRGRIKDNLVQYLGTLFAQDVSMYPGIDQDVAYPHGYRHKHQHPGACSACSTCIAAEARLKQAVTDLKMPDEIKAAEDAVQFSTVCEAAEKTSCDVLQCDRSKAIQREKERPIEKIEGLTVRSPMVHFGQIGSDSKVMKSGYYGDAIALEKDIIAFEMESAGVWDTFPTMVVKGVCDYADSHKRKNWQNYAAATAAACMKALLMELTPSDQQPEIGLNDGE
jgi:nucleoside phosphorylase